MKKFLTGLVLIFSLSQNTFAQGITPVRELLDNYTYAMEVEWDQKDEVFKKQQEEIIIQGIQNLLNQGISSQKLLEEVLKTVPDNKFKTDVLNNLSIANQKNMHPEELQSLLMQSAAAARMEGAQWSPVVKVVIGVAVTLLVARIALEIYFHEWEKRF